MLILRICLIIFFQTLCASYARNSSLTFVIDDTGSMEDDIHQVQLAAANIMDIVTSKKGSEIKDVVLVTFNDPGVVLKEKTSDKKTLLHALAGIVVYGGGDCPEYALSGIIKALQESGQESYLYVFTDATAKDNHKLNEVKSLCERKQSQVVFVLTNFCRDHYGHPVSLNVFHDIARACNGLVIHVSKHEVKDIVDTVVLDTISDEKTVITSRVIPASSDPTAVEFNVDDKTEYVTIHTSGKHVELVVKDDKNHVMETERKLWKSTVKMVKFYATRTGTYYAWVKGNTDITIVVYARTDFTFNHGFSEFVPKSLADTSKQPIADRPHYVSISVTDPEHTVDIKSAEILDMNERVLQTLPLNKAKGDFYITDKFTSPSHMFKIQVTGTVKKTGKDIKRISKTAIEPQIPPPPAPKAPVVIITEGSRVDVDYAGDITLTCKVSGYPPPRIWWTSADGTTVSTKSNAVELPYDYISYLKLSNVKNPALFYCRAQNKDASEHTQVQLNPKSPFTVKTPPGTTTAKYGEKKQIPCDISSSHPMEILWKTPLKPSDYTMSADKKVLTIKSVDLSAEGRYSCEATLKSDTRLKHTVSTNLKISGLAPATIYSTTDTITVAHGGEVNLECKAGGIPKPLLTWEFKSKVSDVFIALPSKGERVSITKIGYEKAGVYRCIATNPLGEQTATTDVVVHGKPRITNIDSVYFGVTGDKVLKIPCEVEGVPEPTITWTSGDKLVTSDAKLSLNKNTLYIKNPTEKDTSNFTCTARNTYGYDMKTFTADISDFITYDEELNSNIYLKLGESTDIKCLLPHSDPQSIRWYVNGEITKVLGTFYSIKNAQYSNDGNYTCRLNTEEGSKSLNYVVDVGYKPSFMTTPPETIDWKGDKEDTLDCDVRAKPRVKVQWFYNGKLLDATLPGLSILSWGQYTCKVSNVHDSVERTFNVTSSGCLINRTAINAQNTPLFVDEEATTWPSLDTTSEFYTLSRNEMVTLECATQDQSDNTFKTIQNAKKIKAKCYKEDTFIVDGKMYKINDLQCKAYVKSSQVFTKKSCMMKGEIIEVGFKLSEGFLRVYEVCYNGLDRRTLYTKVVMSAVNKGNIVTPSFKHRETKGGGQGAELRKCAYSRRLLVNPEDVAFGPAQAATLSYDHNAVMVYEPCEGASRWSWSGVEKTVESALYSSDAVTVWTGASQYDNSGVPRYLWKVVMFEDNTFETIVYVNAANPSSSDILCPKTTPDRFTDVTDANDQYTYACLMSDFLKAFKVPYQLVSK